PAATEVYTLSLHDALPIFEFAKSIEAARPWINYGLDVATGKIKLHKGKDDDEPDDSEAKQAEAQTPMMLQMGMIIPQVQQFLDRSEEHTSELQSQSNLVCR